MQVLNDLLLTCYLLGLLAEWRTAVLLFRMLMLPQQQRLPV
jgi:hypothetical protein